ncbi:hypothetical protein KBC89_00060 [Candidatus Woesebacteria bacterium]|nr:hypothetical protein [Candidatus Woesebacteria bacterium]
MAKLKPKKLPTLTVEKMPEETEQQYSAWLLYCETGSFNRLLKAWNGLTQRLPNSYPELEGLRNNLSQPVSRQSIKVWSKKYRWVERTELRLVEELAELKDKTDRFRLKRKYLITDILTSKMTKLQRQARTENSNVAELRSLWEMHRTEFDETTSKSDVSHHINEAEQYPPTEDEKELGREMDELIKRHYDKKR